MLAKIAKWIGSMFGFLVALGIVWWVTMAPVRDASLRAHADARERHVAGMRALCATYREWERAVLAHNPNAQVSEGMDTTCRGYE